MRSYTPEFKESKAKVLTYQGKGEQANRFYSQLVIDGEISLDFSGSAVDFLELEGFARQIGDKLFSLNIVRGNYQVINGRRFKDRRYLFAEEANPVMKSSLSVHIFNRLRELTMERDLALKMRGYGI